MGRTVIIVGSVRIFLTKFVWAKSSTYMLNHRHSDCQKIRKFPVVMVGPGTGVAPMQGILQEKRQHLKHVKNVEIGRTCLFFWVQAVRRRFHLRV